MLCRLPSIDRLYEVLESLHLRFRRFSSKFLRFLFVSRCVSFHRRSVGCTFSPSCFSCSFKVVATLKSLFHRRPLFDTLLYYHFHLPQRKSLFNYGWLRFHVFWLFYRCSSFVKVVFHVSLPLACFLKLIWITLSSVSSFSPALFWNAAT